MMRIDPLRKAKIAACRLKEAAMASPLLFFGGKARFARRHRGWLEVRRLTLPFPDLPRAWDGVTLTHLTDLHLGPTFLPDLHLPPVVDACRELGSDLIAVTGDWIDQRNEWLAPALARLRELRPPLGWWGVLGNHDFRESRWRLIRELRGWMGDRLLINRTALLERGGERLALSGLDYAMSWRHTVRHLDAWGRQRPPGGAFEIVLSHHPWPFEVLKGKGIGLMLAGHTHGGQISLTPAPLPSIGPASYQFRYLRGLYEEGGAKLVVSCGLGHTLPIRLNCPPEVWQVKLIRG